MSQLSDAQVLQSRERDAIHRPGLTDRKSIHTPPQSYIQLVWLTPKVATNPSVPLHVDEFGQR